MGGRTDTILTSVKFGDDLINSLDFSFTGGGVPLRTGTKEFTGSGKD